MEISSYKTKNSNFEPLGKPPPLEPLSSVSKSNDSILTPIDKVNDPIKMINNRDKKIKELDKATKELEKAFDKSDNKITNDVI